MKKFSIIFLLIVIFIWGFNNNSTNYVYAEQNNAKAYCIIEASSNRILDAYNENEIRANASTTKIATFLTVLKHCKNFDEKIKVDDRAIGISGTSIYLKKGEELTVKELLYGMMLVSGNDAATALALHISNSVSEFAELMTKEAIFCGAKNTTFKNPHGLDEEGHKTTAYDLCQITRECYKYPIFEEIVSTKNITIPSLENNVRYLKNKNKLLWTLSGANGVKTGFTDDAGRCLVSSAKKNNMHLICVVLSCGPMFEQSSSMLEDMFEKYHMSTILPAYSYIKSCSVGNSNDCEVRLFVKKGFSYPLTVMEEQNIKIEAKINDNLSAPLGKEEIVGELEISLDNHLLFSEKIITMDSVKSNRIGDIVQDIISKW